jgi:L1 cell adhesion molecule like protein
MVKAPAIGTELGTTYSCVGMVEQGKVEIIANDQGNKTTSSQVAFTDTERLFGDAAKAQLTTKPCNSIVGMSKGYEFYDINIHDLCGKR